MEQINVLEAKTHFSRLLQRVEAGEEIVIARAGKPVARLGPLPVKPKIDRRLGLERGRFVVPDDFDEWPADIAAIWEDDA